MNGISVCLASVHGTERANRVFGCICPDAIAARRAMRPEKVRSRRRGRPERWVAEEWATSVRRLTRAGESAAAIAIRLGISERTVARYRARMRAEVSA